MDRNRIIAKEYDWDALVALRKESVDRNIILQSYSTIVAASLSARRAWIEMVDTGEMVKQFDVALRKESVDRN